MANTTKSIVAAAVMAALQSAAANSDNSLAARDVPKTAIEVTNEVAPIIENANNAEPHWWEKRTVWATIISGGLVVAGPFLVKYGIDVDEETKSWLVGTCVAIGGIWSAYLSWRAGRPGIKPLGK